MDVTSVVTVVVGSAHAYDVVQVLVAVLVVVLAVDVEVLVLVVADRAASNRASAVIVTKARRLKSVSERLVVGNGLEIHTCWSHFWEQV